jgi:Carboxypeptidase regulatory-like domain
MGPRRTIVVMAVGLALAASATAAPSRSGLHGTVLRGPITPVCRVDVPCDAPAAGLTLTFSAVGVVRETKTDKQGAYRIALPPGIYAVRTSSKPFGQTPRPARVHVRAGHSDRIVFRIDTGIR